MDFTPDPLVAEVGEAGVIAEIVRQAPSTLNGDDAAVLGGLSPNSRAVVSTDMMLEGRHFRRDWSTPEEVGHKVVLRNFADIEAMGARPISCLLALAVPPQLPVSFIRGLARGIAERCAHYNAELVGGDVTRSEQLVITVTAVGSLGGDRRALTLDRARAGQQLVAHGNIGHSAAGMALLERFGRALPPELDDLWPLIDAHTHPWISPGRGMIARATGATAMTDNSDGLVRDLGVIANRSNVGIELRAEAIKPGPLLLRAGAVLDIDPWEWVLQGGEDHTLLGTTGKGCPSGFRVIGDVVRNPGVRVDGRTPLYTEGWRSI